MLYGWKTWILLGETERKIPALDMKCFRNLLQETENKRICWQSTPAWSVPRNLCSATGKQRQLLRFAHTARHDTLTETVLQGCVEGGLRRGRKTGGLNKVDRLPVGRHQRGKKCVRQTCLYQCCVSSCSPDDCSQRQRERARERESSQCLSCKPSFLFHVSFPFSKLFFF